MAVGGAITVGIIFYLAFMVGLCALFVWACKKIAEGKGLPSSYMWFGLLGLIGLIVVAVIPDRRQQQNNYYGYQQYPHNSYGQPNQYGQNPYGQPNEYGQNPYGQPNQYGQNPYGHPNQYGQNIYNQNMNQQGYTLNGQQYSSMHNVTTCSKCGASMSGDSDFCPFCGTKVK
ncbi:MAG: hypothetical protein IJF37_07640 [Lachnospiraceae bacterium]|nr:hypothetical protein [Lachnospiraceae bacterium]